MLEEFFISLVSSLLPWSSSFFFSPFCWADDKGVPVPPAAAEDVAVIAVHHDVQ